jgi:hypothetical protein
LARIVRTDADPKEAALRQARCLNPHPEHVRDPAFLASEFFDARDLVQVKYEMVRRRRQRDVSRSRPCEPIAPGG